MLRYVISVFDEVLYFSIYLVLLHGIGIILLPFLKNKGESGTEYQLNFNYSSGWVRVNVKLYQKTFASLAK